MSLFMAASPFFISLYQMRFNLCKKLVFRHRSDRFRHWNASRKRCSRLKRKNAGMPATLYCWASSIFSSQLTLPTISLSASSSPICSMIGDIMLHGPHHTAQKSTKTGLSDRITFSSKFSALISIAAIVIPSILHEILLLPDLA